MSDAFDKFPIETERELLIIGDRVLIAPDMGNNKTDAGLYLPVGLKEKEKVQSGTIIKVGPGYILPSVQSEEEPWNPGNSPEPQYIPLQVKEGDYAIFLKGHSTEIEYQKQKYLIVPQAGILGVVREKFNNPLADL